MSNDWSKLKARKKPKPIKIIKDTEVIKRDVPEGFLIKACPGTPKLTFKFNSRTGKLT